VHHKGKRGVKPSLFAEKKGAALWGEKCMRFSGFLCEGGEDFWGEGVYHNFICRHWGRPNNGKRGMLSWATKGEVGCFTVADEKKEGPSNFI